MRAIGLDMSLTCAGVAIIQVNSGGLSWTVKRVKSGPTKQPDAMRYHLICEEISDIICLQPDDFIFIEEYAYGANGQITRIAELGGILRYKLLVEQEFDAKKFFEVGPSVLKKFITGKGNAQKDPVMKEVFKQYGFDAEDNNEADACGLGMLGGSLMLLAAGREVNLSKPKREALDAMLKRNKVTHEQFAQLLPKESADCIRAEAECRARNEASPAPGGPRRRPGQPPALAAHHAAAAHADHAAASGSNGTSPAIDPPALFARRRPCSG